ncbi:NUDIX domain-containing protein [Streptomyces exfoliatus]
MQDSGNRRASPGGHVDEGETSLTAAVRELDGSWGP